ncbi:MAG: DUF5667 domain-containing protein [Candidatus Methanoperedens sp.]|nr:DUF5667 domain-containing protein [Candidatus Methanoperedens sp.]
MKDKNMGYIVLAGAIFLALAFMTNTAASQTDDMAQDDRSTDIVNDIEPYNGPIGPGSALYGLKIAFEKFDETFTFNSSRKIQKQIDHARLRLAEVKAGLNRNDIEEVNRAIERYREKIEEINESVSGFTGNASQLVVEQRRIIRHQLVLRQLIESHPDSTGLERAFNNSQRLEERFELKTRVKFEREIEDRQRIRIREIEIEKREIKTEIRGNAAEVKIRVKFRSDSTDRDAITRQVLDRIKLAKDDINNLIEIETEDGATPTATATVTGTPGVTSTPTTAASPTITGTPTATGTAATTPAVTGTPEAAEDRLKIEVEAGRGVSEVEAELRFSLNTTDRDEIVEGIFQKVSALTIDDINRLEIEIRERREGRREDRREDRRGTEVDDDRGGRTAEAGDDRGGSRSGGSSRGGGDD